MSQGRDMGRLFVYGWPDLGHPPPADVGHPPSFAVRDLVPNEFIDADFACFVRREGVFLVPENGVRRVGDQEHQGHGAVDGDSSGDINARRRGLFAL